MTQPASSFPPPPATWDDLDHLPEGEIGEIVDGVIQLLPRPDLPHAEAASNLGITLGGPFRFGIGGPGGWIVLFEPRIRFGHEIRVPDLAGWRVERWVNPPRTGPIPIVPDWVCEVISPGTEKQDRTTKRSLYAREGVGHLWLLHPEARTLEVSRLEQGQWRIVGLHADRDRVRAEPFDAIELDLSLLWS